MRSRCGARENDACTRVANRTEMYLSHSCTLLRAGGDSFFSSVSVPRASRRSNWKPATSALGFIFNRRPNSVDVDDDAPSFPMRRPDAASRKEKERERETAEEKRPSREREREQHTEGKRCALSRNENISGPSDISMLKKEIYYSRRAAREFSEFASINTRTHVYVRACDKMKFAGTRLRNNCRSTTRRLSCLLATRPLPLAVVEKQRYGQS